MLEGDGGGPENEVDSMLKKLADSIPYLVPTQFQESNFPPMPKPVLKYWLCTTPIEDYELRLSAMTYKVGFKEKSSIFLFLMGL
jgi:hypothetical protein